MFKKRVVTSWDTWDISDPAADAAHAAAAADAAGLRDGVRSVQSTAGWQ